MTPDEIARQRSEVIAILRPLNPRASDAQVSIYASAYVEHVHAQAQIDRHGSMVEAKKGALPVENPYTVVRDRTAKIMLGLALRTGDLWTRKKDQQ